MKINVTKEWCEQSAEIEGDSEIGAGCPPRPCSAGCGICGLPVGDIWPFHLDCEPMHRSGDPGDFNVGDKSGYLSEPNISS
jgi:hypothetical protein